MENTNEATDYAVTHHAEVVETDTRETGDHLLVMMHDPTIDRTTTGSGTVASMTLADIERYRTKAGNWIPTEDAFVSHVQATSLRLLLELKAPMDDAAVDRAVRNVVDDGMATRTAIHSFSLPLLSEAKRFATAYGGADGMGFALLVKTITSPDVDTARTNDGINVVNDRYSDAVANPDAVAAYRAAGGQVGTWTPDTATAWAQLPAVDYVITDHPYYFASWRTSSTCTGSS
jgi:glycerophosphoryl diester phosphodiesterase